MAVTKTKRSVHRAQLPQRAQSIIQAARPKHRRATNRHPDRRKPAERRTRRRSTFPGQFVLNERNLPHRRFVEFSLVRGKTIEKVELFTTRGYHSIAIDFQDHTSLNLTIEPTFILNAEFQQRKKGDIEVLAEWPPIHPQK